MVVLNAANNSTDGVSGCRACQCQGAGSSINQAVTPACAVLLAASSRLLATNQHCNQPADPGSLLDCRSPCQPALNSSVCTAHYLLHPAAHHPLLLTILTLAHGTLENHQARARTCTQPQPQTPATLVTRLLCQSNESWKLRLHCQHQSAWLVDQITSHRASHLMFSSRNGPATLIRACLENTRTSQTMRSPMGKGAPRVVQLDI